MLKRSLAALAFAFATSPSFAADQIRIGFITNLSGPLAAQGEELQRGLDLALEHLGGKVGGLPTEVFRADTRAKPDVAVTEVSRLVDRHHVQMVTGILMSNEFNAIGRQLNDQGIFVLSGNAGSSFYSGKGCLPNVFATAFHNDTAPQAVGQYMNSQNIKSMATVGLNYQAGRDFVGSVKRAFKGAHLVELYPDIDVVDFSSAIAQIRSANPEAVYIFLPGRPGIAFLKQFVQAGLDKKMRVFGASVHADELNFSAIGDVATMLEMGAYWVWSIDTPENKKFVDAFKKKHGRLPNFFAAHQYDAIMLIDGAVRAVNGKIEDTDAFRAALRNAEFKSIKGKYKFNVNHYPIQDLYIVGVDKGPEGVLRHKLLATAAVDQKDPYYKDCDMKW
jgi:branched-chain amino acid transport system substrate-binding protein